jgi:hypothetical protein
MYKILLILFLGMALNAKLVDGVAVVVKGEAITLYELKQEMINSQVNLEKATNILIRKKLEEIEIEDRKIKVSTAEVYDDIKQTAARNGMSVGEFYEAVRSMKRLTSQELKAKTKEKLLSQKLYSAIAYASMSQPSDDEIKEYFNLHINEFEHATKFSVIVYSAKDKAKLQDKISNPMFFSPDIQSTEKVLEYNKIPPDLASFLQATQLNSFTPIIPDGNGFHMSFFVQEKIGVESVELESVKNQIVNSIMGDKREQVLSDYFARLRGSSEIKTLRTPE